MRRRIAPALALLVWAPTLLAQAPLKPGPGAPAASAAPAASVPAAGSAVPPPPPAITDPLLEPPPQAARVVTSWREALAIVKARSVDIRIALGDIERADAQARQALAALMPTLTGTGNATKQLVRTISNSLSNETEVQLFPSNSVSFGVGLAASMPLVAPRAWYARGTAEQNQRIAQLSLQEQRRQIAGTVANALVSVITAGRVAELNRIGLRGSLERLALTKRRAELGVANALDVLRLEQDAAAARATIITGDESLRQAREALGVALGYPEGYGVPRDLSLDVFARDNERSCGKINAVEDRSDVAVARERVELTRRARRDVELQFYPTVDLRTNYTLTLQPFVGTFGGSNGIPKQEIDRTNTLHSWTIAGVLTWNLFDGGVRYAQLRDTRAQADQAEARVEQARRGASIEVTRTNRGVEVAEQSRKIAEQARDLAREAERLTRVGFELGRGTSLELVDAARQLRQADVQLALREFDVVQARIRAILALSSCDY